MKNTKSAWFSENEYRDIALTRKKLLSEIRRIAGLKMPLADKMAEIRYLIEQYFEFGNNEDSLNANLP